MNEKEGPMNMNVTPPVEPVTEFEVPLPPDRKRPKDCCYLFAVSRWGFWLEGLSGLPFSRHIGAGWAICPIWLRPQQPAP